MRCLVLPWHAGGLARAMSASTDSQTPAGIEFAVAGAAAGRSRLDASIGRLAAAAADFPGAARRSRVRSGAMPNDRRAQIPGRGTSAAGPRTTRHSSSSSPRC